MLYYWSQQIDAIEFIRMVWVEFGCPGHGKGPWDGSGGYEIHISNDSTPIDYRNEELVDFDVVLRDPIDPTTYSVYVGCGGCYPSDPIVAP
eukprot:7382707-Prymnesium_polylepis.1